MLGEVVEGEMHLNAFGAIVDAMMKALVEHFPNLVVDSFVVMPDHVHVILIIRAPIFVPIGASREIEIEAQAGQSKSIEAGQSKSIVRAGLPRPYKIRKTSYRATLGHIVGYLRYQSAKGINALRGKPGERVWHRDYDDRVVRNVYELEGYRQYIADNPKRWTGRIKGQHSVPAARRR
jgi:REP element-mobilizing transposase RayT